MKKTLLIAMAIAISSASLADTWTDPQTGIKWTYYINIRNNAIVGAESASSIAIPGTTTGRVEIPSFFGGFPAVRIGANAFWTCRYVTEITIPSGVLSIGDSAFGYCHALREIIVPGSVQEIGVGAFGSCPSLTNLVLSTGVKIINRYAFSNCTGLTGVTIPASVTSLGEYAFNNCNNITKVRVSNGQMSFRNDAFHDCLKLNEVVFEGPPPSGLENAAINKNAAIWYNYSYHVEWQSVIPECGFTNAKPYNAPIVHPEPVNTYLEPVYVDGIVTNGIDHWVTNTIHDYTVVESSASRVTWNQGWYVVTNAVTISKGVKCDGAVNLLLTDTGTLTISGVSNGTAGIEVTGENTSLTIYGQRNNAGMLKVSGVGGAGIGGSSNQHGTHITINGGNIIANGGGYAAGIGGGWKGNGRYITINGGVIVATGGDYGAGIGGGREHDPGSGMGRDITINGGRIIANGGYLGAGIGSGYDGSSCDIVINGGTINATGGGNKTYGFGGGDGIGLGATTYSSSRIYAANEVLIKAGDDSPPTKAVLHNANEDIAAKLKGLQFATVSKAEKTIELDGGLSAYDLGNGSFEICGDGELLDASAITDKAVTNLVIGPGITKIGSGVFQNCRSLRDIAIGEDCTEIGASAFGKCRNVTNVVCKANGGIAVGDYAFLRCNALESLTFASKPTFGEMPFALHSGIYMKNGMPEIYAIPQVSIAGSVQRLMGSEDLVNWTPITTEEQKLQYHFFRIELAK